MLYSSLSGVLPILLILLNNSIKYNEAMLLSKQELVNSVVDVSSAEDTLIFTHILFRHGDRTPTPDSTYARDPNKYASYWPFGIGQLTKNGMIDTYKLGLELRQRYNNFLGPRYFSDLVGTLSSPKTRCQTSLQCVLTSLFPPTVEDLFLSDFPWRPIQYNVLPADRDDTFATYECDNYWDLKSEFTNKTVLNLIKVLEKNTGDKVWNISTIFSNRDTILVAHEMGKELPDWVSTIYPEPLNSVADTFYNDIINQRLRLGAAGLYRRISTDIVNKLQGSLSPPSRKMMLYSAHEQTIVFALGAIKAYDGQVPKMASYMAFELHHINGTYGIKVFFQNYDNIDPVPINILNQGYFCELDVFTRETRWLTRDPKPYCKENIK